MKIWLTSINQPIRLLRINDFRFLLSIYTLQKEEKSVFIPYMLVEWMNIVKNDHNLCPNFQLLIDVSKNCILLNILLSTRYIGSISSYDSNHFPYNSHYDVLTTTLNKGCS